MNLLYIRIYNLDLPVDLQIKLFEHTIIPILTYGCVVWGFENLDILNIVYKSFLKKICKAKKSTPTNMLFGELGITPLDIIVKTRMIGFWNRLLTGPNSKLSAQIYRFMTSHQGFTYKWPKYINSIFTEIGRPDIWLFQSSVTTKSIKYLVKSISLETKLELKYTTL